MEFGEDTCKSKKRLRPKGREKQLIEALPYLLHRLYIEVQ